MSTSDLDAQLAGLQARISSLEDEAAITKLVMAYGPAADAGLSTLAANLWDADGVYDWDADRDPRDRSEVETMLESGFHLALMAEGVAHFAGPLLIRVDGDLAVALNYSLIMRREEDRHYLWRVSAVRWDLVRHDGSWRIRRRTNRLLDASGKGSELFGDAMAEHWAEETA